MTRSRVRSAVARLTSGDFADIPICLLALALGYATFWTPPGNPLRVGAAVLLLVFLPGYALTTAVYPARKRPSPADDPTEIAGAFGARAEPAAAALSTPERAALSVGLSVALTPLFGLAVEVLAGGFRLAPMSNVVLVFVTVVLAVGTVRRLRTPREHRFAVSLTALRSRFESFLTAGSPGTPDVLNVALTVVVVASVGSFGLALVAPQQGTSYSDLYVLSETDQGEFAAKNYPASVSPSGEQQLQTVVENHEGSSVEYTLVVAFQEVNRDNELVRMSTVDRYSQTVEDGEKWEVTHTLDPPFAGEQLRVRYFLYRGPPPSEVTVDNAYRTVSFRTNATTT